MSSKPHVLVPVLLAAVTLAAGRPTYIGYSGAPGARGTCASSCHGSPGGTVEVAGFPEVYTPGQTYRVTVRHSGGSSIKQFNGSCRAGSGSETAGVITAGLNSETYTHAQEPNGVHLSSRDKDSCVFSWTAPTPGVGEVRLYIGAHQGNRSGPNTELVVSSTQGTGVNETQPATASGSCLRVEPSVVRTTLVFRVATPNGAAATLRVLDGSGRVIARMALSAGQPRRYLAWVPVDVEGERLTEGVYFAALNCQGERLVRKFVLKSD